MGTLEKIRQTSPFIIGAFAIILIAFFVISDIDPNSLMRNRMKIEEIAIVNGEPISYKEFESKARMYEEQQRANKRQNPDAQEVDPTVLRNQLYDRSVDEIIINQEAEKAGAQVTDGAILDIMLENPPQDIQRMFSDSTGKFAREAYIQYMTKPEEVFRSLPAAERQQQLALFRETMTQIQDEIKSQLLVQNIQTLVGASGSIISPLYAQEIISTDTSTATVDYIAFDLMSVKDDEVKVTEDEIKQYYDKNKEYYTQPEQRRLKYYAFPIVASHADSMETEKKVKRIFESLNLAKTNGNLDSVFKERLHENSLSQTIDFTPIDQINPRITSILATVTQDDFVGPFPLQDGFHFIKLIGKRNNTNEEVKASHILIPFEASKDSARMKILNVLAESKNTDFAELARKYSSDGSAQNGGDLGFFKRGQMVKEFEDAAFNGKPGQIVGPVETQFGFHLIKIAEKKNNPIEEISYSDIIVKPQISNMARNQIKRKANEIANIANDKGLDLDSATKQILDNPNPAMESPFFTKERGFQGFDTPYAGLYSFEAKKGKTFGPWEDANLGLVVAQVVGERKAGIASLEDKRDDIKNNIIRIKKLDILKKRAEEVYQNIKANGWTLTTMKSDSTKNVRTAENIKNTGNVPALGLDYSFTQNAFMKEIGKVLEPIRGERAYYIMQINTRNIVKAPEIKDIPNQKYAELAQSGMQNAFNMWYTKVRESAKIEDKRLQIWGPGFE